MAYAEQAYASGTNEVRSTGTIKSQMLATRDNLLNVKGDLYRALHRVRGPVVEPSPPPAAGNQMPDPDHIVWLGEQIVVLSAECDKLLAELGQHI
jgi:hypothetical protein